MGTRRNPDRAAIRIARKLVSEIRRRRLVSIGHRGTPLDRPGAGKLNHAVGNPTFNPLSKPGVLRECYRGNAEAKTFVELTHSGLEARPPEYMDRDARVSRVAEQGFEVTRLQMKAPGSRSFRALPSGSGAPPDRLHTAWHRLVVRMQFGA